MECMSTFLTIYLDMEEYGIDMRGDGGGDRTPVDTDTPVITADGGELTL